MKRFAELVSEMRYAQKQYFKTRNSEWLVKAKELEKKVDLAVLHYIKN